MTASIISTKAQLVDDLILYDTCLYIVGVQIMGLLMISGFSYSVLQLSIDKGNFLPAVTDMANMLLAAVRNYISLLCTGGDTFDVTSGEEEIEYDYSP